MSILITGAAGFIGSNLAGAMLARGRTVFGVDNFSRGRRGNLAAPSSSPRFAFRDAELSDLAAYRAAFASLHAREPIAEVWHLAANSDVAAGMRDANVDRRDTFMTTFNTLELMREFGVRVMALASSSAVYGDRGARPISEDSGPLLPVSNYGAMKLASEGAVAAAAESALSRAYVFRFPNVVGTPATHGALFDFARRLEESRAALDVLGDGEQRKDYLHVEELIEAMFFIRERAAEKVAVFNIGAGDGGASVRFLAEETVRIWSPGAAIRYGEGRGGWPGDVPRFVYSVDKLRKLGWTPELGSEDAVRRAVREIWARRKKR